MKVKLNAKKPLTIRLEAKAKVKTKQKLSVPYSKRNKIA